MFNEMSHSCYSKVITDVQSNSQIMAPAIATDFDVGKLEILISNVARVFDESSSCTPNIEYDSEDEASTNLNQVRAKISEREMRIEFNQISTSPFVQQCDKRSECKNETTALKWFDDMSGRYIYAYSFDLGSTRYIESGGDILIMAGIILMHKIKWLQCLFDPGVYVAHDVRWGGSSLRHVDSTFGAIDDFIIDTTKLSFKSPNMRELFKEPLKHNIMKEYIRVNGWLVIYVSSCAY